LIADDIFYNGKIFEKDISVHDKNSIDGLREYIDLLESDRRFKNIYLDISDGVAISIFKGE
jgi:predicted O-methyltransferase YrrM